MKFRVLVAVAFGTILPIAATDLVSAQDLNDDNLVEVERPVLSKDGSNSLEQAFPPAAVLRQARAIYRSEQRLKRLERNAWIGHSPLRPTTRATPMTTSRYTPQRLIHVPIFVYSR